ncbi:MAG: signal peptidase I [Anaerolineae bacterium]|nr:signal peptidase I [Anaerolineae bacterium]
MAVEVSEAQRDPLVEVVSSADPAATTLNPDNLLSSATTASQRPRLFSRLPLWRDLLEVALVIATIYTLVNLATARAIVEGSSMHPNFETGQLIIVNRFVYFFGQPERGDVIVLHNPRNHDEDYIKRVVGLPGEVVTIQGGHVYINGVRLEEPYIPEANICLTMCEGTWSLQKDEYFVLGDNRRNSTDSHAFGPIKRDLIVGKAWVRYWPLNEIGLIPHQSYDGTNVTGNPITVPQATATPIPPGIAPGRQKHNGAA